MLGASWFALMHGFEHVFLNFIASYSFSRQCIVVGPQLNVMLLSMRLTSDRRTSIVEAGAPPCDPLTLGAGGAGVCTSALSVPITFGCAGGLTTRGNGGNSGRLSSRTRSLCREMWLCIAARCYYCGRSAHRHTKNACDCSRNSRALGARAGCVARTEGSGTRRARTVVGWNGGTQAGSR